MEWFGLGDGDRKRAAVGAAVVVGVDGRVAIGSGLWKQL